MVIILLKFTSESVVVRIHVDNIRSLNKMRRQPFNVHYRKCSIIYRNILKIYFSSNNNNNLNLDKLILHTVSCKREVNTCVCPSINI